MHETVVVCKSFGWASCSKVHLISVNTEIAKLQWKSVEFYLPVYFWWKYRGQGTCIWNFTKEKAEVDKKLMNIVHMYKNHDILFLAHLSRRLIGELIV